VVGHEPGFKVVLLPWLKIQPAQEFGIISVLLVNNPTKILLSLCQKLQKWAFVYLQPHGMHAPVEHLVDQFPTVEHEGGGVADFAEGLGGYCGATQDPVSGGVFCVSRCLFFRTLNFAYSPLFPLDPVPSGKQVMIALILAEIPLGFYPGGGANPPPLPLQGSS